MGQLILSMFVTLDGYAAGPDGDIDWFAGVEDTELDAHMAGVMRDAGAFLLGRATYDMFTGYWPSVDTEDDSPEAEIARFLNPLPKLVVTTRPDSLGWGPARALGGDDLPAEVARARRELEGDLVMFGGVRTARPLIDADAFDEYQVVVNPVVLGAGQRLLGEAQEQRRLRLITARSFPTSGAVALRYATTSS